MNPEKQTYIEKLSHDITYDEYQAEKTLADRLGNSIERLLEYIHKLNPMSNGCVVEAEELLIKLDNRRRR